MKNRIFVMLLIGLGFWACEPPLDRDKVVAKVNGRVISVREFEQAMQKTNEFPGQDFSAPEQRQIVIRNLVNEELLFAQAQKAKVHLRSNEVKKAMVRAFLQERFGQKEEPVGEQEITDTFAKEKHQLEQVRISHILIAVEAKASDVEKRLAKEKADKLLAQLRRQEEASDFANMARQHSDDKGSKNQGGDLNYIRRGQMVPAFEDAAFALTQVGNLSPLVESEFGYHLLKLTGDKRSIGTHRQAITQYLQDQKKKALVEHYLQELRATAKVQVNNENIMRAQAPHPIEIPEELP